MAQDLASLPVYTYSVNHLDSANIGRRGFAEDRPVKNRSGQIYSAGNGRYFGWRTSFGVRLTFTSFRAFSEIVDFTNCIVLAIAGANGGKQIIAGFDRDETGVSCSELNFANLAEFIGVTEWHLHFLKNGNGERQKIIEDLMRVKI